MNTREHETMKMRGSSDISYLGQAVDSMIYDFMREQRSPGLRLPLYRAPYIPRVVGYGMSDEKQRRLASPNTMWPAGHISQAFAAVAVMQLYEDGRLDLSDTVGKWIQEVPEAWKKIEILQLLRHARVCRITASSRILIHTGQGLWRINRFGSGSAAALQTGNRGDAERYEFSAADGNCGKGGGTELP